jgi:hypothetical protein
MIDQSSTKKLVTFLPNLLPGRGALDRQNNLELTLGGTESLVELKGGGRGIAGFTRYNDEKQCPCAVLIIESSVCLDIEDMGRTYRFWCSFSFS